VPSSKTVNIMHETAEAIMAVLAVHVIPSRKIGAKRDWRKERLKR